MLIFIRILVSILILFAVMILFLLQNEVDYNELSKYRKVNNRVGMICYLVIILGFIGLFFIDRVLK